MAKTRRQNRKQDSIPNKIKQMLRENDIGIGFCLRVLAIIYILPIICPSNKTQFGSAFFQERFRPIKEPTRHISFSEIAPTGEHMRPCF